MTALPKRPHALTEAPTAPDDAPVRPRLAAVVKHLALALLTANVIPSALFYGCLVAGNIWLALIAALTWCYGALAWRISTKRRASGLLYLALIGLTVKTTFAFASGSTFIYFLQPALTEALVALIFAVSLLTARPIVAHLAGDFYPMDDDLANRPRIQRLFWRLTLLWAVICGAKAAVSLWMLHSLSTNSYVAVKSVLTPSAAICGTALTVLLALRVARREGLVPGPLVPVNPVPAL